MVETVKPDLLDLTEQEIADAVSAFRFLLKYLGLSTVEGEESELFFAGTCMHHTEMADAPFSPSAVVDLALTIYQRYSNIEGIKTCFNAYQRIFKSETSGVRLAARSFYSLSS